ncbi:hypothetical protein NA56DRAFT_712548 [Hyaloscypha hepaticicola]|uniref:Uncharacterized protein n=1 Tax=Hyaloscypha hepaticicola TaxID=2082293 RepID=A0A2J6PFZ2_9HELO|nr:hypothetical protein NA56DRAFT_712548 [Hyaloscypha hepaticicola]
MPSSGSANFATISRHLRLRTSAGLNSLILRRLGNNYGTGVLTFHKETLSKACLSSLRSITSRQYHQYHQLKSHLLLKARSTSLLLRFARNRFLFTYNTRNCQRNVNSDFVNSKRDLKIDRRLNPPRNQGAFLNPPPVGIATRTSIAGTCCFVT